MSDLTPDQIREALRLISWPNASSLSDEAATAIWQATTAKSKPSGPKRVHTPAPVEPARCYICASMVPRRGPDRQGTRVYACDACLATIRDSPLTRDDLINICLATVFSREDLATAVGLTYTHGDIFAAKKN